jgi:phosphatidylserine decarboxylase
MQLPLTRHGRYEMIVGTLVLALLGWALSYFTAVSWLWVLVVPVWVWLIAFFRDPVRPVPGEARDYVSPADGMVSDIRDFDECDVLGEPAIRIGIFLSVFNVHVNRIPCNGMVTSVIYRKGKFINALHHEDCSGKNEANTIVIADEAGRPVAGVRQLVGLIARRIVCDVKPGDRVQRGGHYGMIKFGSRTELYIPRRLNPQVRVQVGQKVRGAADILASVGA